MQFSADKLKTSGSILSPSEVNNLVGIKPTVGLTSRSLVIPISQRQDTVGPLARTVRDAAYLLQVSDCFAFRMCPDKCLLRCCFFHLFAWIGFP